MRVIFAGTPEFAATALQAIHAAGFEVPLVLTQPDRPAGRGMQLHASAVKQFALQHGIPVAQPQSLRLEGKYPDIAREAHDLLNSTPHDVMVVAAYGLILPTSVLNIPRLGCLNIHGSLLPRWRGAAPIHRAIEAGDTETGITIMQMEEGLDTGPMLLKQSIAITDADTTGILHDKLAVMGGEMIVAILQQLQNGVLTATVQPEAGVNYASKISKEEAGLDFNLPAEVLARKIRAFNPFPGTHAQYAETTIKI
ncbi:MAG: methionyl-tRNA formyltransferase, partial [Burkholderiales bacterium]|nr:methionyl-tRNA formyltransferase [Burkholderiales bacterium]